MSQANLNNPGAVTDEISKSIRDLLTMKMTLPLGNPNLKNVHTNQYLWCPIPDEFKLENFEKIANEMEGGYTRYKNYEKDRWYIEGVNIKNDGGKFEMELTLNPFPTSLKSYAKKYQSFGKAYQDAQNTGAGGEEKQTVKSTGGNCPGGEGEYIDNIVRNIVGNETDELAKAKLIHNHIKSKQHYSSYSCSNSAYKKNPELIYKNITHINCADMATLTRAMMASAGLTCYVVHNNSGDGHFWVVIEIGGKKYASDNASTATREFDYYWNPVTRRTEKAVNGGNYYYNRGKTASC